MQQEDCWKRPAFLAFYSFSRLAWRPPGEFQTWLLYYYLAPALPLAKALLRGILPPRWTATA